MICAALLIGCCIWKPGPYFLSSVAVIHRCAALEEMFGFVSFVWDFGARVRNVTVKMVAVLLIIVELFPFEYCC